MKLNKSDIILYIICLVAVLFSFYCLTQVDNVEDNCRAELARIINNSPCAANRYDSLEYYIVPINLSGVK